MIFVTLGTQNFPMNRVIDEIDHLIEVGYLSPDEVIIQHGYSKKSKFTVCHKFLKKDGFLEYIEKSDIVITHAGTGSILKALANKKKVICIPRQQELGEHVDDHQKEISDVFSSQNYLLELNDISELKHYIQLTNEFEFKFYESKSELLPYLEIRISELMREGKLR